MFIYGEAGDNNPSPGHLVRGDIVFPAVDFDLMERLQPGRNTVAPQTYFIRHSPLVNRTR